MKFIVSFHKWKLMNAWTHLTSQLQHIFYCLQSFPAALNHLTWSLFCVLANGHHLLLSFTTLLHSWPWSLSLFTVPGHIKISLHEFLPAVSDGSPAAHSRTGFCWGGVSSNILVWGWCSDSHRLFIFYQPQSHQLPNTIGQHQVQQIFLFYIPKTDRKLGYWGQVMLRLISQG